MTKKQMIKKLDKIVCDIEDLQFEAKRMDREIKEALQHSKKSAMIALEKIEGGE